MCYDFNIGRVRSSGETTVQTEIASATTYTLSSTTREKTEEYLAHGAEVIAETTGPAHFNGSIEWHRTICVIAITDEEMIDWTIGRLGSGGYSNGETYESLDAALADMNALAY
jgi:hypothetical protein